MSGDLVIERHVPSPLAKRGKLVMKNRLYSVGLILAASVAFSPTVVAQELEEIVVTAQRRAQDMQDVPIMVSAFTRDAVKDLGWNDVTLVSSNT